MINKIFTDKDRGFSLVEALVGLTIFLIALGFIIPLLANNQLNTINKEIATGAVSVSQRILDEVRQTDVVTLPSIGTQTTLPSGTDISSITELGKTYSAKIIYCATTTNCSVSARELEVQVNYNGQQIYTVKTIYTRLQ